MPTDYKVTLYRKDEKGLPVITPCNLKEGSYNRILKIIQEEQKELTQNRKGGMKYRK